MNVLYIVIVQGSRLFNVSCSNALLMRCKLLFRNLCKKPYIFLGALLSFFKASCLLLASGFMIFIVRWVVICVVLQGTVVCVCGDTLKAMLLEKWFPLKSERAHSLYFVIQLSPPFIFSFL